ncbi:cytochrome P450 [Fomitopsis serialis]|uniref:cytochrome P450 n=1 Tax=Fomitopsis serialis TaxID=139415 RepID=UPI002007D6F8|nr:cytochrome P450 [Neoantrodia serialis]KAH9919294.1 cytochrome P450 [Neoantrodia serialis]
MRVAGSTLHKIPGPPVKSFWTGHLSQFFARDGEDFQRHLASYGPITKINGFLGQPILCVADPKALHHILIEEEHMYQETEDFILANTLYFGPGLTSTLGQQHAKQRKILNPVFSMNHIRRMLPLFCSIAHKKLRDAIRYRVQDGPRELDVLSWMNRTALELIGQGGLGCTLDPLVEDRIDPYGAALKALAPLAFRLSIFIKLLLPLSKRLVPGWLCRAVVESFPTASPVNQLTTVVKTMHERANAIYQETKLRVVGGDPEVVKQIDERKEPELLSCLIRANTAADVKDQLSEEEIVGQISTLLFSAMDTTSNALSRILHLLAQHPHVQQKLRHELLEANAADGLSYEELNKLPILDSVCRETLRLHPPATFIFRVATKDTVLPLFKPITLTDGRQISEIPIAKGSEILLEFLGCNISQSLWGEDSLEWKPERWLSEISTKVADARVPGVYSHLMTFAGGKRACIGFKFAEMEMKTVLSVLVSTFTFELSDKPIVWNMAGIMYPTAGKESSNPSLPMKVGLYNVRRV